MMKLRNFMQVACMATAVLTAFSCSQEEFDNGGRRTGNTTITATFEGAGSDTRTIVNDDYKIVWQESDALGLFCMSSAGAYSNTKLEYQSGAGNTSATFSGTKPTDETAKFSIYPYQSDMSVSGQTLTMILPAILTDYAGTSNGPMYAKVTDANNLSALSFKHMAAMIKLTVNKIPAEATTFKITASNNIAGTCTANLNMADPVLAVTDDGSAKKEITATFTASSEIKTRSFFIPLPVGTYSSITAQLTNGGDKVYFTKTLNDKILGRRDILVVPALDCVEVTAETPSALSTALSNGDNLPQTAPEVEKATTIAVSGTFSTTSGSNDAIAIPVVEKSNVNLAFNTLPTTSTSAPLKLADKTNTSITTPAETSTNSVSLAVPEIAGSQEAPSVEITMASSTVTLAAVGEKATYNEVTATTAKQTLIVDAGVTIKKLTVKGGNLNVNGKIETLVYSAGQTSGSYAHGDPIISITKGTGAELPESIPDGFVVEDNIAVLKTKLAAGGTYQLTTDADIKGLNIIIPADKESTLDLNGHTLTAANKSGDNIRVEGKLTLKDSKSTGKIVASEDYSADYSTTLIYVTGENASMTMESGTISAARPSDPTNKGQYGVGVYEGADFTMTGGKIEAGWYAVAGNGNYKTQNSIINITGGELISTADYALYLPQAGTTTISGNATITGACGAIGIRNGSLVIGESTTLVSNGTGSTGDWKDGTSTMGNAVISIGNGKSNTYGNCTVTINGGTFTANGNATAIAKQAAPNHTITIGINGGTFSDPTALAYAAANANLNITLNKDIAVTKPYLLETEGTTTTINLNNHDITNSTEIISNGYGWTQIFIVKAGILNIEGSGNVKCDASNTEKEDGYRMAVEAKGTGTINIHGGSYFNTQKKNTQIDLIYARGQGKINIYGGTFESGKYGTPDNENGRYWVLNILNASKETADIKVYGGTFINFNPAKPNVDDKEPYTADGYEVTRDNAVYTEAHKVADGRKEYIVRQKTK